MAGINSLYTPLNEDKLEFRLIDILDTPDGSITCKLTVASFSDSRDKPHFTALSYVWGNASDTESITINDRQWPITKALAIALRHVKDHWQLEFPNSDPSTFRIWVDAICINQHDLAERASQVARMRHIYMEADTVLAWLGSDEIISPAFEAVTLLKESLTDPSTTEEEIYTLTWVKKRHLLNEDDNTHEVAEQDTARNSRWHSTQHLFYLPYWQRVWIFQEVVMAHRLVYCCPSSRLHAVDLTEVGIAMEKTQALITSKFMKRPDFMTQSCWYALSTNFIRWDTVTAIEKTRQTFSRGDAFVLQKDLGNADLAVAAIKLSTRGGSFQATDPKDHIYGLLGMTHMTIWPDYRKEKSWTDVYCEYVAYCLQIYPLGSHSELDELFFLDHARPGRSELPSWAPDFPAQSTSSRTSIPIPGSVTADADIFEPPYKDRKALVKERSLFVVGVQVGVIKERHIFLQRDQGGLLAFCLRFCSQRREYVTGIPPLQAIFRVFRTNAEVGNDYTSLPVVMGFLLYLFVYDEDYGPEFIIRTSFMLGREGNETFDDWIYRTFSLDIETSPDDAGRSLLDSMLKLRTTPYLGEVERTVVISANLEIPGAVLFETEDGYLGMAPQGIVAGDAVVIFRGYKAPVTLRKENGHWVFVSACFVLGLMKGEAQVLANGGKLKPDVFELK